MLSQLHTDTKVQIQDKSFLSACGFCPPDPIEYVGYLPICDPSCDLMPGPMQYSIYVDDHLRDSAHDAPSAESPHCQIGFCIPVLFVCDFART